MDLFVAKAPEVVLAKKWEKLAAAKAAIVKLLPHQAEMAAINTVDYVCLTLRESDLGSPFCQRFHSKIQQHHRHKTAPCVCGIPSIHGHKKTPYQ